MRRVLLIPAEPRSRSWALGEEAASGGETTFPDLAFGVYCVVETTVPDGYSPIEAFVVEIGENEADVTVPVANVLMAHERGSIEVVKWLKLLGEPQRVSCQWNRSS